MLKILIENLEEKYAYTDTIRSQFFFSKRLEDLYVTFQALNCASKKIVKLQHGIIGYHQMIEVK